MQHLEQTAPSNTIYRSDDEIDLIDLIGFLWKIRKFIAFGITLGVVGAGGFIALSKKKAQDPQFQNIRYELPLTDQVSGDLTNLLPTSERITRMNALLTTPEIAQVFLQELKAQGVFFSPTQNPAADTAWFIAQQQAEPDKQKLAKIVPTADGRLIFSGTFSAQIDGNRVTSAVPAGLNKMIEAYNAKQKILLETEQKAKREKVSAIIRIRTEISAQFFRLRERLGPANALTDAILTGPEPVSTAQGAETEISRVIRTIGLLEQSSKMTKDQASAEKDALAQLQARYLDLEKPQPEKTPAKPDQQVLLGLLLPFTVEPFHEQIGPDEKNILPMATPPMSSSGFNKSPTVLLVLGLLLGGFLGTLAGGLAMFWKANADRIKSALAS